MRFKKTALRNMINDAHAATLGAEEDWTLVGDFNITFDAAAEVATSLGHKVYFGGEKMDFIFSSNQLDRISAVMPIAHDNAHTALALTLCQRVAGGEELKHCS